MMFGRTKHALHVLAAYGEIGRNVHATVQMDIAAGMDTRGYDSLTVATARSQAMLLTHGRKLNEGQVPSPDRLAEIVKQVENR